MKKCTKNKEMIEKTIGIAPNVVVPLVVPVFDPVVVPALVPVA